MKRIIAFLMVAAMLPITTSTAAHAAAKAGATCKKAGTTETISGKKYTCIKSGSKLIWDKGVAAKKSQTISADKTQDIQISDLLFTFSAKASSGLPVKATSNSPQICQVNSLLMVGALKAIGRCSITLSQPGNSIYESAPNVTFEFNILKMSQTIEPNDEESFELYKKSISFSWYASSGLPVSLQSLTPKICTISGEALMLLALGTCEVQGTQNGNREYEAAPTVNAKYQIIKSPQIITFSQISDVQLDEGFVDLEASSDAEDESISPVFVSTTPDVCDIDDNRAVLLDAGECTIEASHPGNKYFDAAPTVSQTFNVLAARLGSLENPAVRGTVITGTTSQITFLDYVEDLDMEEVCSQNPLYDGCILDSNLRGIPDPDWTDKLIKLEFEYKNTTREVSTIFLIFSIVYEEEVFEIMLQSVPQELNGKKVLANSKARGYVYLTIPQDFVVDDIILLFENFDTEGTDIYIQIAQ